MIAARHAVPVHGVRRERGRRPPTPRAPAPGPSAGLSYLLTAPGDLGHGPRLRIGRPRGRRRPPRRPVRRDAAGDEQVHGSRARRRPRRWRCVRSGRAQQPRAPAAAAAGDAPALAARRRGRSGTARRRDAEAIHHHYDVSNRFYELRARAVDDLHVRRLPDAEATLEEAQDEQVRPRRPQARPGAGRCGCSTSGCGWGGMVRHAAKNYGVKALGVTLSREQATWAQEAIKRDGLDDLAEVRHLDYRDVAESEFDAISSIGLTEHIGIKQLPGVLLVPARTSCVPGGRLLNHCITRPHNRPTTHRRVHRPLHLPRRRAHRVGPDHHRDAGRRLRGAARGEPARALRDDAAGPGRRTSPRTGTSASPRPVRARRGCGVCTCPAAASASSQRHPAAPGAGA